MPDPSSLPLPRFEGYLELRAWSPAEVRASDTGRQQYTVLAPLVYHSAKYGPIVVPPDMPTDGASIPRFAWRYIDPEDPCILYPSIVHDYLYSVGGTLPGGEVFTREQADDILVEAMAHAGARWDQRVAVRGAVRLFGAAHWGKGG
ncbi:MAG TPA: DUF1353 domain-containing protein [Opitutaceae bacterium]